MAVVSHMAFVLSYILMVPSSGTSGRLCFLSVAFPGCLHPGKRRANLSVFRTFVRFALVWFCLFRLLLSVWEGLRLVIVALPGHFSYLCFTLYLCECLYNLQMSLPLEFINILDAV